jgi:hypothetical protein
MIFPAGVNEWTKENLKASTEYEVKIAQAADGSSGYGMKTLIRTIKTG